MRDFKITHAVFDISAPFTGFHLLSNCSQTAKMAIKIIEGADVSETAVEYPETVSLHINEDIAKQLGIDTSKLSVSE